MANKILYIRSKSDRSIDECLMVVPDGYVEAEALEYAQDAGIEHPFVEGVINLDAGAFVTLPPTYRTYIG